MTRIRKDAFKAIDIAPLVLFRIAFGAIMLWEVWRYFHFDRINRYYINPTFYFSYFGFEWLSPLPGTGMTWLFHILGGLSICIIIGLFYRPVMVLFFLCFSYIFLLDMAQYLNHFYLISLMSFLLIFVPAHRAFSVDVWLNPDRRSQTAPAWTLWILRWQLAIVYFFGGIAKLNGDWLRGEPMRLWLSERIDFPLIGRFFTVDWIPYFFSYGGLLLDLLIVPLLLWHRTRWFALLAVAFFHLMNARLFNIGVFPWFALAGTVVLFLPPHWLHFRWLGTSTQDYTVPATLTRSHNLILALIMGYFAFQILIPLRHFLYPGDVNWTEEGHKFAWHMRLRSKRGNVSFHATDTHTNTTTMMDLEQYLSSRQFRQMINRPEMILELAQELGSEHTEIRVWNIVSLNDRAYQLVIDPSVNLAAASRSLGHVDWILPLEQPLKDAIPLLLVLRLEESLYLINMTTLDFPLGDVRIGEEGRTGSDWDLGTLPYGTCVAAHMDTIESNPAVICNKIGTQLYLPADDPIWDKPLQLQFGDSPEMICSSRTCIIPARSDGE